LSRFHAEFFGELLLRMTKKFSFDEAREAEALEHKDGKEDRKEKKERVREPEVVARRARRCLGWRRGD
jgi:hypothetical protein